MDRRQIANPFMVNRMKEPTYWPPEQPLLLEKPKAKEDHPPTKIQMQKNSDTEHSLTLAKALIERPSITPIDAGCQDILTQRLEPLGFAVQSLPFEDVKNFWAIRGQTRPIFVFSGHTDVVPTGDPTEWNTPPFSPTVKEGYLFGRGAADMKGSLAAMVTACERFISQYPNHNGSIAFLITSDEEGQANNGTVKVLDALQRQGVSLDYCLVGEPSSQKILGDTIKNGRRGSLNATLTIFGKQGHVAYPEKADNPIHRSSKALLELTSMEWDRGNAYFPPTTFQIANLQSGTGATNVIPGTLTCQFNFRFSTESTPESLQAQVNAILKAHNLNYKIDWQLSGMPFLTKAGKLITSCTQAIQEILDVNSTLSTSGGTSDGRFIATTGCEVVELGLCNTTIHSINECVKANDLHQLSKTYERILQLLLLP